MTFHRLTAFLVLFSSFFLNPSRSSAGGSFATEDIWPLLLQDPELNALVTGALDLDSGGWAVRIGSNVNERLGGSRIAPYSIRAKPKGSPGPWVFYVIIEAETQFLDTKGVSVELSDAVQFRERLIGVKIIPLEDHEKK